MVAPKADTTAIITRYRSAFQQMRELTGFSQRQVLHAEAGSILKTWAGRTKVSTAYDVEKRARRRVIRGLGYTTGVDRGDVTVNATIPFGRVWIKVRRAAGRKNWLLARGVDFNSPAGTGIFPNPKSPRGHGTVNWFGRVEKAVSDVRSALRVEVPRAIRSIGLARQSVIQIADALRIDLNAVAGGGVSPAGVAKARAAIASSGRAYKNGYGYSGGDEVRAYVQLINRLPFGGRIGIDRTLLGVLAGRAGLFRKAYSKGVFNSLQGVARAYPNLMRVTKTAD